MIPIIHMATTINSLYDGKCKVCGTPHAKGTLVTSVAQGVWCSNPGACPANQVQPAQTQPAGTPYQAPPQQQPPQQYQPPPPPPPPAHWVDCTKVTQIPPEAQVFLNKTIDNLLAIECVIVKRLEDLGMQNPNPAKVGMLLKEVVPLWLASKEGLMK